MAKMSKTKGKAKSPGKAGKKRAKVGDLPVASRKARTVKGGALGGNLPSGQFKGYTIRGNTVGG